MFLYFLVGIAIPFVVLIVVSMIPYFDYETFMKFPSNMVLSNYAKVMRSIRALSPGYTTPWFYP